MNTHHDTEDLYFRDGRQAFQDAIRRGDLSINPQSPRFAGLYMYMHSQGGRDSFKHIETRAYLHFSRR